MGGGGEGEKLLGLGQVGGGGGVAGSRARQWGGVAGCREWGWRIARSREARGGGGGDERPRGSVHVLSLLGCSLIALLLGFTLAGSVLLCRNNCIQTLIPHVAWGSMERQSS